MLQAVPFAHSDRQCLHAFNLNVVTGQTKLCHMSSGLVDILLVYVTYIYRPIDSSGHKELTAKKQFKLNFDSVLMIAFSLCFSFKSMGLTAGNILCVMSSFITSWHKRHFILFSRAPFFSAFVKCFFSLYRFNPINDSTNNYCFNYKFSLPQKKGG